MYVGLFLITFLIFYELFYSISQNKSAWHKVPFVVMRHIYIDPTSNWYCTQLSCMDAGGWFAPASMLDIRVQCLSSSAKSCDIYIDPTSNWYCTQLSCMDAGGWFAPASMLDIRVQWLSSSAKSCDIDPGDWHCALALCIDDAGEWFELMTHTTSYLLASLLAIVYPRSRWLLINLFSSFIFRKYNHLLTPATHSAMRAKPTIHGMIVRMEELALNVNT